MGTLKEHNVLEKKKNGQLTHDFTTTNKRYGTSVEDMDGVRSVLQGVHEMAIIIVFRTSTTKPGEHFRLRMHALNLTSDLFLQKCYKIAKSFNAGRVLV